MTDTGSRVFSDAKLVVASHNQGKVTEICDLLEPLGITAISAAELGLPEPEETGSSFIENAELKAQYESISLRAATKIQSWKNRMIFEQDCIDNWLMSK